jgi:hypothetical protein
LVQQGFPAIALIDQESSADDNPARNRIRLPLAVVRVRIRAKQVPESLDKEKCE